MRTCIDCVKTELYYLTSYAAVSPVLSNSLVAFVRSGKARMLIKKG